MSVDVDPDPLPPARWMRRVLFTLAIALLAAVAWWATSSLPR